MTDNEYDERAAYTLLNKIILDFREQHQASGILDTPLSADKAVKFPAMEVYLRDW